MRHVRSARVLVSATVTAVAATVVGAGCARREPAPRWRPAGSARRRHLYGDHDVTANSVVVFDRYADGC